MSPRAPRDPDAADERFEERFAEADAPEPPEPGESEYRRRRRPVQVRRRSSPELAARAGGWMRRHWIGLTAAAIAVVATLGLGVLLLRSGWFMLAGSDQIAVQGNRVLPAATVRQVFSSDLGRNVFFIPLRRRQADVESIAWVRQAAVLRIWPNRLQVRLQERTPLAQARCGTALCLVDGEGALMERLGGPWDFPVVTGLAGAEGGAGSNSAALLQQRRAQLQPYLTLAQGLDANGAHGSAELSEVAVGDAADLVVLAQPKGESAPILVHLGDQDLTARYQRVRDNLAGWRQQHPNLQYVDMRFPGEVVLPTTPAPPARGGHR